MKLFPQYHALTGMYPPSPSLFVGEEWDNFRDMVCHFSSLGCVDDCVTYAHPPTYKSHLHAESFHCLLNRPHSSVLHRMPTAASP